MTVHATSPQYWNHMWEEVCTPSKMGEVDVLWWWPVPLEERLYIEAGMEVSKQND